MKLNKEKLSTVAIFVLMVVALSMAWTSYAGAWTISNDVILSEETNEHSRWNYATAVGSAIAETIAPNKHFELREIRIHLDAVGGTKDFTVTMDSARGSTHDTVILTQDMTAVEDLVVTYLPDEMVFQAGDELDFAWDNDGNNDYGISVRYKLY